MNDRERKCCERKCCDCCNQFGPLELFGALLGVALALAVAAYLDAHLGVSPFGFYWR